MIQTSIRNQRGSILLNAIVTTVIIAIISGTILQQSLTTLKTLRLPRVKSVMSGVEGSLRNALLQPTSFTGCNSAGNGSDDCLVDANLVPSLSVNVPGCVPMGCGVRVINNNYDAVNKRFTADIIYQGTEIAVKPVAVTINVPVEVLTAVNFVCPASDPIFSGFNAQGRPICNDLDDVCPAGQYVSGFDQDTLQPLCQTFAAAPGTIVTCGAPNQFMTNITWDGTSFNPACLNRQVPSTQWPYTF